MRKKLFIKLAVLISMVILICSCDDLGSDYKTLWDNAIKSVSSTLTNNMWSHGDINAFSDNWFNFTATADIQYIHASFETETLSIRIYNSDYIEVGGGQTNLGSYGYTSRTSWTLTSGQEYHIKITNNGDSSVQYQIAFNDLPVPLGFTGTTLTDNTWTDGNINDSNGDQWFKFTASANTQYIHSSFGNFNYLYVQVYDLDGNNEYKDSGGGRSLYSWGYTPRTLTSGQDYYIRVTYIDSSNKKYNYNKGYYVNNINIKDYYYINNDNINYTYQIAFNNSSAPPPITLPTDSATQLYDNTWADCSLSTSDVIQWFKFDATSSTQYIYTSFNTSTNLCVQFYDSSGNVVEGQSSNGYRYLSNWGYLSISVTSGSVYYIRVIGSYYGENSTCKIAFNASSTPPPITLPTDGVTALTADTWTEFTNSNSTYNTLWFKFTANANPQYIHVSFDTSNYYYLNVQLYDSVGNAIGSKSQLNNSNKYVSQTVTSGQEYYIRISNSYSSGTYQIAFNTSSTPP